MRTEITTEAQLRDLLGHPMQRAIDKERQRLAPEHRDWLAASPFCLVATSDAHGRLDVSPKGDPAGFALALDDTTIAIPERPGNRRADGFVNVLQNPHVGLLFLVPGRGDTLRINGRATLLADAPYADRMEVKGHRPGVILEVAVEQVFFHCAKAFLRSDLWQPETWRPDAVMSRAQIAKNLERPDESLEQIEAYYGQQYAQNLY
ncbi:MULTISPECIES: pyridoxamine 5'-phosphate oxidase family protein [Aeromicrobium]|uniref:Pyridoxamine 5'-phosphate oxidase family protein n=1 Tax=Aeromicrobium yanjiei TaxID=2662028 RepID=A0A5Q2MHI7_9ACTN|nr:MULTISPECIES: pyridoxamine 5'-phosphate oxidase family protein [Aeromicrobium]MRK02949.1 pyridoxamine 5'-phosphate oxidase family protein [Aeromicrobium sp. S22]QGG40512.1 pyridoxamine 5'-phosphate oxidase family protein [Aeromicrobium yanjiei]